MKLIDEAFSFWRNQSVNFKLMLFRNAILTLFNNLTAQYTSIYIRKLGATPQDISYLESAASFVTMILAIPAGLVIDRVKSIRKLYIMGGLISLPISLLKGLSTSFQMFFTTRMWESITTRFYWPTIEIIQISSITNRDRVKGLVTSNMFISTLGLVAPLIAAYIITSLGGLENVDSYRPLFYIQFIASFFIYIIIVWKLKEPEMKRSQIDLNIFQNFKEMFREVPGLKWILLLNCVNTFFMQMRFPLIQIYFYEIKNADAYILGLQSTVATAVSLILSVPMGSLTDRVGRRKMAYLSQIVFAICVLMPILTPSTNPEFLLLYNFFSAMGSSMEVGWFAFIQEYIPLEMRGRWAGISTMMTALIGIPAPLIGGIIWNINPDYHWYLGFVYYLFIAIPLMLMIPENNNNNVN
ncbi:MFS transporter [Candidatus Bathyarchaeota archaeon]|nr:MFS transporter [Candidatus Bathyarchaeota archaeon]